nr:retrovirus-related Pol polyprotein from transposon TNT 1-94 [Tanacetum cinerariifolium]
MLDAIWTGSTSGACKLLSGKLMCWSAKKQQSVAMSSAEVDYVVAAGCCANILWMKSQLTDYHIIYEKDKILSHPSPPIPVVGEMHKEAQQAAVGPTSLGHDVLAYSTAKADPRPSAPNDYIPPQQGMDEGNKNTSYDHIFAGSNPNVLVDKTKSTRVGMKTVHTESGASKELIADEISKKIKLEDLADLFKDTRSAFFTPDYPPDEPINVSDESDQEESQKKELEQLKAVAEAEVASLTTKPLFPDINQLTTLLELPADIHDLPHLICSVQETLKTLDSLPDLLNKVTNTLNRFANMVKNASRAITADVPSAGKATTSPDEGEKNIKDANTNQKNELVDLLGIDVVTQYYNKKVLYGRYYEKMKKRRQSSKIITCDVLTKKGHMSLKIYRENGTAKVIENLKASDLHLAE